MVCSIYKNTNQLCQQNNMAENYNDITMILIICVYSK